MLLGKLKGSKMLEILLTLYKRNTPKYLQTYDHLVSQLQDVLREQQTDASRARQLKDIDNLHNRKGSAMPVVGDQPAAKPKKNAKDISALPSADEQRKTVAAASHLLTGKQLVSAMASIDARAQLPAFVAKASGKGANGGCNNCGSQDHWVRDCPDKGGGKGKGGPKGGKETRPNSKPQKSTEVLPEPSKQSIALWERTNAKGQSTCLAYLRKECVTEPDGSCPKGFFCHDIPYNDSQTKEVLKHEKALRKRSTSRTQERKRAESADSGKGGGKGGKSHSPTRKGGKGGGKQAEAASLLEASTPPVARY